MYMYRSVYGCAWLCPFFLDVQCCVYIFLGFFGVCQSVSRFALVCLGVSLCVYAALVCLSMFVCLGICTCQCLNFMGMFGYAWMYCNLVCLGG